MVQAVVGGLFGILIAWISIAGRSQRVRAAIKAQLEILRLLEADHPRRPALEDRIDHRLAEYLESAPIGRFTWPGIVIASLFALGLLSAWNALGVAPTTTFAQVSLGLATGALTMLVTVALRVGYVPL
jgi:hypothetical protein